MTNHNQLSSHIYRSERAQFIRQNNRELKDKLATELLPTFLKWLVEGAVRYYNEGGGLKAKSPQKVKDATDAYFEKQNVVKKFVTEECELGQTYFEECHAFFVQFQSSKPEIGVDRENFVFGLKQMGILSKRVRIRGTTNRETRYIGVRLRPVGSLEEGAPREENENNAVDGI